MHALTTTLLLVTPFLSTTLAADPCLPILTSKYHLKTNLKSNQPDKQSFANLYLTTYHTGAGMNDAVFTPKASSAAPGYLLATNVTTAGTGEKLYDQVFNLSSNTIYPWGLVPAFVDLPSGWRPVQVSDGLGPGGFWFNASGLQWQSSPSAPEENEFAGWLVCDWWLGVPQLFFRVMGYDTDAPSSCADVDLTPEYV